MDIKGGDRKQSQWASQDTQSMGFSIKDSMVRLRRRRLESIVEAGKAAVAMIMTASEHT